MEEKEEFCWYVGYTYPKCEKKVFRELRNREIQVFLPLQTIVRQWSDRIKKSETPLFPSYIFVKTDLPFLRTLTDLPGISRFISFAGKYATVTERELSTIRTIVKTDIPCARIPLPFGKGAPVEIAKGPLNGLRGEVIGNNGAKKFFIRIASICEGVTVEIPPNWLVPT